MLYGLNQAQKEKISLTTSWRCDGARGKMDMTCCG